MANEFIARLGLIALDNSAISGSLTVTNGITSSLFGTASWSTNALTSSFVPGYISGSGTTNYISKFTAGGIIGPSQIFDNGTSVGIGTTSPAGRLHIKQTASEIPFILDNSNGTSGSFTQYRVNASTGWEVGMAGSGDSYKWFFSYGTFSSTNSKFTITNTGDIGVGTIAPQYKLHVVGGHVKLPNNYKLYFGDVAENLGFQIGSDGASNNMVISQANNATLQISTAGSSGHIRFTPNSSESVRFTGGGNVGIGTTTPEQKLVVSNAGAEGLEFIPAPSANSNQIQSYNRSTSAYNSLVLRALEYNVQVGTTPALYVSASGNVGIGGTTPNRKLEVITGNGTTNGIRLTYGNNVTTEGLDITYLNNGFTTASFDSLYNSNSAIMQFRMKTASTPVTAMTILGSGNIGIGTTAPGATLDVYTTGDPTAFFRAAGDFNVNFRGSTLGNTQLFSIRNNNTSVVHLNTQNSARLALGVSAATGSGTVVEHVTINSSGNVGIGTTSPASKLDVNGKISAGGATETLNGLSAINSSSLQATVYSYNYNPSGWSIYSAQGINYFSGSVGIGTTSPLTKLHISSPSNDVGVRLTNTTAAKSFLSYVDTSGNYIIYDANVDNNRLTINSAGTASFSGNVSIGTTNADSTALRIVPVSTDTIQRTLHIGYNGSMSSGTHGSLITFGNTTPSTAQLARIGAFYEGGTYMGSLRFYTNTDTEGASPSERMRITAGGNVGIGTTSPNAKLDVNGNAIVSGSFTVVTGSAVELQVTNTGVRIGNATTDNHPVTGSLNVTGSATLAGTFTQTPFKSIIIRSLSASATQAREFEILRGITDFNDWSETGVVEIEVHEQQWGRGLKKTYSFSYGYFDAAEFKLVEMIGSPSSNNFQLRMGSKTLISGEVYYYPVYAQVRNYGIVDIIIKTRRNITTNSVSTTNGDLYVNTAPTASNISDFTADNTVTLNNAASNLDFTGSFGVSNTITAPNITSTTTLNANGTSATFNTSNTYINSDNIVVGNNSTDVVGIAANTMYFPGNGRVAIGTTTPQRLLDVYNQGTSGIVASFGAQVSNTNFSGISFGYVEAANTSYRKSALVFERSETHGGGSNASGKIHFLLNNNGASSATALTDAVVTIDSVGTTVGSARVGIGTRFPTASLHISGSVSTDNLMRVQSSTGTEYFFISASGNIGAGTTSPSAALHIARTAADGASIRLQTTNSTANGSIQWANSANSIIALIGSNYNVSDSAGGLEFIAGGTTTRMFISSSGNVGIGTTTPVDKLEIEGNIRIRTGNSLTLRNATNDSTAAIYNAGGSASSNIYLAVGPSPTMTIGSNVGIGTTSPSYKLDVAGNFRAVSGVESLTLFQTSGWATNYLKSDLTTSAVAHIFGKANTTNNSATLRYYHAGDGSTSNYVGLGFYGNDDILRVYANGNVTATSFVGTASWANNATSSSYALTASYALTSAGGGGSSFPYTGNALISGSLILTGSFSMQSGSIDIKPYTSGGVILTGDASEWSNSANYTHPQIRLRDYRTGITFVNNTEVHIVSNTKAIVAAKTVSAIPRFILASDTQLQWSSAETNGFTLDTGIRRLSAGVLEVTSSIVAQSFTGSLQGTSSWAVSASWAPSAGGSAPTAVTFNRVTGNYTFVLSDAGKTVEVSASAAGTYNLTVPPASTTNFADGTFIDVILYGTGSIQFVTGSGVTFRSANNWTKLGTRYGAATLINIAGDEWYLIGNLNA